jgi:hypothetical protein
LKREKNHHKKRQIPPHGRTEAHGAKVKDRKQKPHVCKGNAPFGQIPQK